MEEANLTIHLSFGARQNLEQIKIENKKKKDKDNTVSDRHRSRAFSGIQWWDSQC